MIDGNAWHTCPYGNTPDFSLVRTAAEVLYISRRLARHFLVLGLHADNVEDFF
jgi:hypothetical protein